MVDHILLIRGITINMLSNLQLIHTIMAISLKQFVSNINKKPLPPKKKILSTFLTGFIELLLIIFPREIGDVDEFFCRRFTLVNG